LIEELGLQGFLRKPTSSMKAFYLLAITLLVYAAYSGYTKLETLSSPASIEKARVIGFVANGKGVIAETSGGQTLTVRGKYHDISKCREGGEVRLEKRGDTYSLPALPCLPSDQDA